MARFNSRTTVTSDSVNEAGGVAYSRADAKQELASVVLNTMVNGDSYYEKEADRLKRVESLMSNPEISEFVAKAMVYTRTVGNLRSISHYMAGILSENVKGSSYLRPALRKTFIRPDDLTETLALWNSRNKGKMVPNSLRRAFKDSLETFDAYQLKKYEGSKNTVKLRDVVKLAHPKGDYKALIEGTLEAIKTAQTINASTSKTDEGKAERAQNYKELLSTRKLGFMAALKNIRNIVEAGADSETIDMLCNLLRNEKAILNSKVLPFRYIDAYKEVSKLNVDRIFIKNLVRAIEDGFIISAKNISIVEDGEKVALLLDDSGSMSGQPFEIGRALMASMLTGLDKSNTVGYLWATKAREVNVDGRPFEFIERTVANGGGTDVWAPISKLIETKTFVDKIVIFTDMQMYSVAGYGRREFKDMVSEYRKINPNVKVLFWNLQGYKGGTPMKLSHDILEVSGFSDKMLEVIPKMWKDKDALIKEIEAISLAA